MTRLPQGAGGFDLNSMMKQVQQMQAEMSEAQEKLTKELERAAAQPPAHRPNSPPFSLTSPKKP